MARFWKRGPVQTSACYAYIPAQMPDTYPWDLLGWGQIGQIPEGRVLAPRRRMATMVSGSGRRVPDGGQILEAWSGTD